MVYAGGGGSVVGGVALARGFGRERAQVAADGCQRALGGIVELDVLREDLAQLGGFGCVVDLCGVDVVGLALIDFGPALAGEDGQGVHGQ